MFNCVVLNATQNLRLFSSLTRKTAVILDLMHIYALMHIGCTFISTRQIISYILPNLLKNYNAC